MTVVRRRSVLTLIVSVSVVGQLIVLHGYLDNSVVNAISPGSVDTADYWARAQLLADGRWSDAFGDAYRMPGYPAVLAVAEWLTGAPLLAVRLLQVVAVAATAVCAEHVVRRVSTDDLSALLTAAAVAFYPPFWFLAPVLYAETLTVLSIGVLLVLCAGATDRLGAGRLVAVGSTVAVLTYLKPNNVLLALPVCLFLLVRLGRSRRTVWRCLAVVATAAGLILPWSVAVSTAQDEVVLLSTNNGYTFYRGSGVWVPSEDSLPRTAAIRLGLADPVQDARIKAVGFALPRGAAADAYWRGQAVRAWQDEPLRTTVYAASKVGHSLGLSFGGAADALLLLVTAAGAAAAAVLLRDGRHLAWVAWSAGAFVAMAVQVALYVPDVRFRVSLLDLPLLVLAGLALATVRDRRRSDPAALATVSRPAAATQ